MKKLLTLLIITTAMLFSSELLEVELEANATKEQPLLIKMSLTNISSSDIYVDKESFPFDQSDISRNMFKVKEDEQSIFYTGIKSRGEAKYKLISSGESYSIYIPLSKFYSVRQGTHQYDIVYTDTIAVKYKNIEKLTTLTSNHLEIETTIETKNRPNYKKSKSIKSTCTSSQRTLLHNDLSRSRNVAQKATQLLPASGYNDSLYKKYFGSPNSGYLNIIYENFKRIYNATQHVNMSCERSCRTTTMKAYVHSNYYQHKIIHICPAYWTKPTNERHGILIHELSHFIDVADTDDFLYPGYGTSPEAAIKLAEYRPHQAIRGAYNYGYYAQELINHNNTNKPTTTPSTGSSSPRYYNFNSPKNSEGWRAGNLRDAYGGPVNGAWFFQVSYNDPQLYSPTLNINANVIKKITIRMANAFNPAQFNLLQVFWKGSGQGFSEANSQVISVYNHGGWVTYTIDLSRNPRWQGNIEQIRIDPLIAGDGHWIAIDSISLTR